MNLDVTFLPNVDTAIAGRFDRKRKGCGRGKKKYDLAWNQRFEEVKKYAKEHGRLPKRHIPKLGRWVDNQKNERKTRAAHTAERKAKLRSISLSFRY